MRRFKQVITFLLALALIVCLLPAGRLTTFAAAPEVGSNVLHAVYSVDALAADGALKETVWRLNIPLSATLKIGAAWDEKNLYLGFNSAVPAVTGLTVNGRAVTAVGVAGTAAWEIKIPLASVDISDLNKSYTLSFSAGEVSWSGIVVLDTVTYSTEAPPKTVTYGAVPSADGWSVVLNTMASTDPTYPENTQKHRDLYAPAIKALAPSLTEPTVIEYDVTLTYLPDSVSLPTAESTPSRNVMKGGLNVVAVDNETLNAAANGNLKEALWSGLYQQDGKLYLCYYDRTAKEKFVSVPVGRYAAGDQHHLRIEYAYGEATEESTATNDTTNDNVTAKYFIDGKLVATSASAKFMDGDASGKANHLVHFNAISTGSSTNEDETIRVDVTVANLNVSHIQSLKTDAERFLTPEYIFGRIDLNHVRYDLPLISEFTARDATVYPLTWVIGDEALVSTSGKITRHATEVKSTTITLKVGEKELWTVTVTLDPLSAHQEQASAENVDAAFSKSDIVIDGLLSEEGWRMAGRVLTVDKQLVAEYGFQWNQTHLFAAIDFTGTFGSVELKLNGKTFTIEEGKLKLGNEVVVNAEIVVKNGIAEIAIPLQVLGLGDKISEYGKSMEMSIKASGFAGAGKNLALTGIDWFSTDNRDHAAPTYAVKETDEHHGVQQLENGWRLFDLYGGSNKANIRSYVFYSNKEHFKNRADAIRLEFDFLATALPVVSVQDTEIFISTSAAYCNSGFTFSFGESADVDKFSYSQACGIINTAEGLHFAIQREIGHETIPLGKQIGEKFSLGLVWNSNARLELYVDGVLFHTFTHAARWSKGAADASLVINMRPTVVPQSKADNHDVSITNIALGKVHDTQDILAYVNFEDIKGQNTSADKITSDLTLPTKLTNGQMDTEYPITWTSSNKNVLDAETGKITRPADGIQIVTLTASLHNGEIKSFELIVHGLSASNDGVLWVENDLNPATGVGKDYNDILFTFDAYNNSLIHNLDNKQKINSVTLLDGDDKARLNPESLTLWISDDNKIYTQIESFKLLQINEKWYLYDFEAEAQYVKVHYTHFDNEESSFIGFFGQMIHASYEEVFGGGKETFTKSEYSLTNNGATKYDYAWTISKKALGITGSDASIRISLDGKLLYHYVDGENVIVRIPEVAAGASVKLTVQQSESTDVLNIANKENVYEITYGYRESYVTEKRPWYMTLPAGTTFPDGSKLEQETILSICPGIFSTSTDGGITWKQTSIYNNAPAGKDPVVKMHAGGFLFDSVTGRIMYSTYVVYTASVHCEAYVIASDDGGKTWYILNTLPCACKEEYANTNVPSYALGYAKGIQLSTYDGKDGNGIDFVNTLGTMKTEGGFAARAIYTRDAGETWHYSESIISYGDGTALEDGCSEGWVMERADGVLVMQIRCQDPAVTNFAVSYSLDQGLTWLESPVFSDIYAVNTQPLIDHLNVNGEKIVVSVWGGNNALGATSGMRNPLVFAVSTNDGDTNRNIQNVFSRTFFSGYGYSYMQYVTNQSLTKYDDNNLLLSFRRNRQEDYVSIRFHDFDKWFTRTKGAYDNFEHGTVKYEGWIVMGGNTELSSTNAQGKYSMKVVGDGTAVTRSVPYLQNGKVSVDVYVATDSSFTLSLQSAFNPKYADLATPIRLRVADGTLYLFDEETSVAQLKEGWNTLTFDLELTEDEAALTVNDGQAVNIPVNAEAGDYVCYITFGAQTDIYVDELLVISDLDPVLTATEEDKKAADAVIELIQAIENADDKAAAVKAARAAFDKLTQTQQDQVDRNALAGQTLVNYYDILVAEESRIAGNEVEAVQQKIDAIGKVTLESKEAIEAARKAYDTLSAEQKLLVKNYKTLTDAEAALKALEEADKVIPPTGDTTPVAAVTILMFLCTLAIAVVLFEIRRKRIGK